LNDDRGSPTTIDVERAVFRRPRNKWLVIAACIAAMLITIASWRTASIDRPAAAPPTTPVSAPSHAAADPTPAALAAVPADLSKDLTEVRSDQERLTQRTQAAEERLKRMETELERLDHEFRQQQAATVSAINRATSSSTRQARRAVPPPQRPPAPPRVLGVDTWDGQPSVAVLVGGEVRFCSEGDAVADVLVKRADPSRQRVEFVTASGASIETSPIQGDPR